jgi:O-antigen/teichoic acid export membrane protein
LRLGHARCPALAGWVAAPNLATVSGRAPGEGARCRPSAKGYDLPKLADVPAEGAEPARVTGLGSQTLRNTALVLTARVASRLLALVAVLIVIRHLGESGYGQFNVVVTTSALVTVVMDLGFNTLFQREGARRPDEISRYLGNLISARLLSAVAAFCIFGAVLWSLDKFVYVIPGFVLMVLTSYSNLLRYTLYAVRRLGFEAAAIVLESLVLLVLVLYGVRTGQGVAYFLWAYAASYAFDCVYFVVVLTTRGIARIGWRFEPGLLRRWFWSGLPFALAFVITTIYFKIDVPILDHFRGDAETGLYGAAYKPFEALLFIPQSVLSVVFTALSIRHGDASGRVAWGVERFYKALLLLGWPITVGTYLLVLGLRPLYVFPASAPAVRILALGIVFMFINNTFIGALNAIDRQLMFTWAALGSMVVNVGLNLVLIPAYGYLGASWATVITEVALTVFGYLLTARYLARIPVPRLSWRVLLAGLIMGLALWPVHDVQGPQTLLVITGGAAVYGAAVLVLRALDSDELALVRRAVGR